MQALVVVHLKPLLLLFQARVLTMHLRLLLLQARIVRMPRPCLVFRLGIFLPIILPVCWAPPPSHTVFRVRASPRLRNPACCRGVLDHSFGIAMAIAASVRRGRCCVLPRVLPDGGIEQPAQLVPHHLPGLFAHAWGEGPQ